MLLLIHKNILYDRDLPSEIPQHSELNEFVRDESFIVQDSEAVSVPVKHIKVKFLRWLLCLSISILYFSISLIDS